DPKQKNGALNCTVPLSYVAHRICGKPDQGHVSLADCNIQAKFGLSGGFPLKNPTYPRAPVYKSTFCSRSFYAPGQHSARTAILNAWLSVPGLPVLLMAASLSFRPVEAHRSKAPGFVSLIQDKRFMINGQAGHRPSSKTAY
ncbi:MAG: hypothetical protein QM270_12070, partial [Bacillota bacterium]|nr:hypothetical protein [Bacillota bacterium]